MTGYQYCISLGLDRIRFQHRAPWHQSHRSWFDQVSAYINEAREAEHDHTRLSISCLSWFLELRTSPLFANSRLWYHEHRCGGNGHYRWTNRGSFAFTTKTCHGGKADYLAVAIRLVYALCSPSAHRGISSFLIIRYEIDHNSTSTLPVCTSRPNSC